MMEAEHAQQAAPGSAQQGSQKKPVFRDTVSVPAGTDLVCPEKQKTGAKQSVLQALKERQERIKSQNQKTLQKTEKKTQGRKKRIKSQNQKTLQKTEKKTQGRKKGEPEL